LQDFELLAGNFSEDARGRWNLNGCVPAAQRSAGELNKPAVASILDRKPKLAKAQRARKKPRTRAIHAKIANRRKDFLHQLSTRLVRAHGAIFVGDVNASALAKTGHAKSVLDSGWSVFRTMLCYKCAHAGVWFDEVDEAFSTRTCSRCNSRTGPQGRQGLGIRGWRCSRCGAIHDRNVNSAQNILAAGHRRLAEGISAH
jgi:IS605 OrfB family transposase